MNFNNNSYRALSYTLLLLGCFSLVHAQVATSGSVLGVVTDPTGAVIVGASVTLKNVGTGATFHATTDDSGQYNFRSVPVGQYELTASKEGFKREVHSAFEVHAAEYVRVDARLTVGQITEAMTVTGVPPVVNTVTANEGNTVTGQQVNTLPLTNRVFTQLVMLEPGVTGGMDTSPGFGSNSSVSFSINGVRSDENNLLIDGVRNVDTFGGNAFVAPNLYSISEFRIESNDYTATAGRSAGGQINLVSRAGTNQFHGNAFEFFRNDKLNAMNRFSNINPENRYNDFGYDIGGPIKKDRLFFFWSQEWRRIIQSDGPNITVTPTVAERGGDFRGRLTGQLVSPCTVNPENPALPTDPFFDSGAVFDPSTTQDNFPCGNGETISLMTPFAYQGNLNVIDPTLLNNNAKLLLQTYFPMPTPGYHLGDDPLNTFNFISQAPDYTRWREESIRVDLKVTDKINLYGRYTQDSVLLNNPYGLWHENPFPYVGGSTQDFPIYNWSLHLTYAPKPTFFTEFTWGMYFANDKYVKNSDLANRNRAQGLTLQEAFPLNEGNHIPTMYFNTGYTGIIEQWFFHNDAYSIPFQLDNTWVKGHHTLRFGFAYTPEGKSEVADGANNTNGTYTFLGNVTGNAMADFLLGTTSNYQETALDPFGKYRWFNLEPYVEDQIKLRKNLTLTAGLRWEYFQPEYEVHNLFGAFYPALYDPNKAPTVNDDGTLVPGTGDPLNGIIIAGKNSPYGRALFPSHKDAFAPRIGVSWDPFANGKTAIRAGYGIFFDRWGSYSQFGAQNPPFNSSVNIYNTSLDNPTGATGTLFATPVNAPLTPWKYPSIQKWSLSVQHQVLKDTTASVAYVGTKGSHLLGNIDINQPDPNPEVANYDISPDSVRPYKGYSRIGGWANAFNSNYNALQASVIHRLKDGISFQGSYTFSKALTDSSGTGSFPQDSRNIRAEYGLADFDIAHIFTFNYSWDLPFFKHATGVTKAFLGGWQVAGITTFQTGGPATIVFLNDNAGVGSWNERPDQVANPFVAGPVAANPDPACQSTISQGGAAADRVHTLATWFNPCAFAVPLPGTFGNSHRGALRNPGFQNWDMSLMKEFPLRESMGLQFRLEAFNTFNHPNWGAPDAYIDDLGNFSTINSATTPRIVQLGLSLSF
jgi:hypothetical protein